MEGKTEGGKKRKRGRQREREKRGRGTAGGVEKKSLQSYIPVDDSSLVGEFFNCDIVR